MQKLCLTTRMEKRLTLLDERENLLHKKTNIFIDISNRGSDTHICGGSHDTVLLIDTNLLLRTRNKRIFIKWNSIMRH